MPNCCAMVPIGASLDSSRRMASALNSGLNCRRRRRAIVDSSAHCAPSEVSTKTDQFHLPFVLCLCPLSFALCPLPFALCPLSFALCPLPFVLCRLPFVLCSLPFVLALLLLRPEQLLPPGVPVLPRILRVWRVPGLRGGGLRWARS